MAERDPRFRGSGQAAFNQWSKQTGNSQGLSFEDWMKPSQANWFKDAWAKRGRGLGTKPGGNRVGHPGNQTPAPDPNAVVPYSGGVGNNRAMEDNPFPAPPGGYPPMGTQVVDDPGAGFSGPTSSPASQGSMPPEFLDALRNALMGARGNQIATRPASPEYTARPFEPFPVVPYGPGMQSAPQDGGNVQGGNPFLPIQEAIGPGGGNPFLAALMNAIRGSKPGGGYGRQVDRGGSGLNNDLTPRFPLY